MHIKQIAPYKGLASKCVSRWRCPPVGRYWDSADHMGQLFRREALTGRVGNDGRLPSLRSSRTSWRGATSWCSKKDGTN